MDKVIIWGVDDYNVLGLCRQFSNSGFDLLFIAYRHIIGSHANTHKHLYTLLDAEVEYEWKQYVEILTRFIGEPVRYASIPNGDKSKRVLEYAKKYGIEKIYTSEPTTKVSDFKGIEVIGRYVLLAENSNEYVLSIVRSTRIRFILSCKKCILNVAKSIWGSTTMLN